MAEEKPAAGAAKKRKVPKGRHLSAIKRHRQSVKRAKRNQTARSATRTSVKKVLQAVQKKDAPLAQSLLKQAISHLHRAASKGYLHTRNASRHIGRLSSLVVGISQPRN